MTRSQPDRDAESDRPAAQPEVTEDAFLGGRLRVLQPAKGFRAGMDAVLLAASVAPRRALRVLDVGAGVGTAGLCVAARFPAAHVTLVEKSPELAELARKNVELNGLGRRVVVIEANIGAPAAPLRDAGLDPDSYDQIIANPPYLEHGRHRLPEDPTAAAAFGMDAEGLERWARFMARMAAPGASIAVIHRADALAQLLAAVEGRFGAVQVLPLHPRAGDPAHRVIVVGRKGSRAPMQLMAGVVLHSAGNAFLPDIAAILRDGAPLRPLAGDDDQ